MDKFLIVVLTSILSHSQEQPANVEQHNLKNEVDTIIKLHQNNQGLKENTLTKNILFLEDISATPGKPSK